uniref:Putative secreted protein n=1 Tax=Anopheles triannulatus TaxID=58253 RepID=A0A2M4B6K2_9DIPT
MWCGHCCRASLLAVCGSGAAHIGLPCDQASHETSFVVVVVEGDANRVTFRFPAAWPPRREAVSLWVSRVFHRSLSLALASS